MDVNDPQVREWLNDFRGLFIDMSKQLDEIAGQNRNTREQARATADGYQRIATAIERGLERGLRDIAAAIRTGNR